MLYVSKMGMRDYTSKNNNKKNSATNLQINIYIIREQVKMKWNKKIVTFYIPSRWCVEYNDCKRVDIMECVSNAISHHSTNCPLLVSTRYCWDIDEWVCMQLSVVSCFETRNCLYTWHRTFFFLWEQRSFDSLKSKLNIIVLLFFSV